MSLWIWREKMRKNLLLKFFWIACLFQFLQVSKADQPNHITLLKEMFEKVTVNKDDKAIPLYYDKDFELYSNGNKMNYNKFLQMHQKIYKTSIQYKIRYDEETFVEQGNKVAGRLFITTKNPNEPDREIEIILIAIYKDHKLYRLWELTYPDWSQMKAFKKNIK